MELQGRRALVCGASAGIGAAVAHALAERGCQVIGVARRRDKLDAVMHALPKPSGRAHRSLSGDLDDRSDFMTKVAAHLEQGAIHICINNTGGPAGGPLLEAQADAFERAFARHVLVAHQLAQMLVPVMKNEGYGRFINVISTSVYEPIPNLGVSNTIRGAMASWAKSMANELPPGITINNVLPGFTNTDRLMSIADGRAAKRGLTREDVLVGMVGQVPEGRLAEANETAEAIAFLASPAAGYIRGVSLPVDGGRLRGI